MRSLRGPPVGFMAEATRVREHLAYNAQIIRLGGGSGWTCHPGRECECHHNVTTVTTGRTTTSNTRARPSTILDNPERLLFLPLT